MYYARRVEAIREFEAKRDVRYTKLVNASDYARKKDGIGRYRIDGNDIAISKDGDSYSIYDYSTKTISKDLSESELRAALSEYDTKRDAAKTAEKEKSAPDKSAAEEQKQTNKQEESTRSFQKRFDAWDGKTEGFSFVLGETPSYLSTIEVNGRKIGKKQVRIDATKLKKIMKDHPEMTADVIKNLPYLLNDPVLVLDSKSVKGRLVLLGEVYAQGKPVMMALEINPTTRSGNSSYVNVIKVASAYTRSNTQNLISSSNIRYVSKNKSRVDNWLKVNRLQLPLPNTQPNSAINSIPETEQKSNTFSEKTSENPSGKSVIAEINEYARKHVVGFDKLNAANKAVIRRIIRQGRARGVKESVLIDYANVAARAKIDVVFDKALTAQLAKTKDGEFVAYADAYYDPGNYRIVANPEAQTSDGVLIHELDHALRKSIKGGRVTTKLYGDAIRAVDADKYQEIHNAYAKGKKMSLADKIALTEDEVEAHYARTALGDKGIVHHLVAKQSSVKDKILSFFKKASGDYIGAPNLQKQAMRYYKQYRKWFNEFAKERTFAVMGNATTKVDEGDLRYALIGRTEDGRGIYRTNYPENTPKDVKQQDIVDFVQNVWSKKPIKLSLIVDGNEVPIEARFNPELTERSDLSKIAFGNRKGTASEKRITMNLSSDLYQIAEESHHVGSKTESGKDNAAHAGVTTWHYFLTDLVYVEADGTEIECYMNIDVKQNDSGHWFYSFAIEKGSRPADVLSVVTDKSATTPTNSIPDPAEKINPSDEISSKKSSNAKDSPDIRYSLPLTDAKGNAAEYGDQSRYSYESLTKKGDLAAVKLPSELPMTPEGKIDNKAVVARGRLNARKQKNPNNTNERTYVRVGDIGLDVLLSKKGMIHGIARSQETAFAVMKIGDVLKNSIAVNELNGSETRKSKMSYVLLGACRDSDNLYVVRSVVSKIENDVTEIDVYQLGAVKGKKTETPTSALGGTGVKEQSALVSSESPTVSIADFLEYVKNIPLINEIFSLDVAEKLGIDRTNGTLSDDLRYSLPLTDDKGNPIEYEDIINKGVPYAKSPDMTVGQMRKHIANTTHYKVFSKSQILEDVKRMPMGDLLKAETREQIADSIWQSFNTFKSAEQADSYIHDMAKYILSASMREARREVSLGRCALKHLKTKKPSYDSRREKLLQWRYRERACGASCSKMIKNG